MDMTKQRSDERLTFVTKCLLDINGKTYDCLVDNISTAGALIEMTASGETCIQVGDTGTLNVLLLAPVTYHCKVVRITSKHIALQFVDQ
ncbi:MAG TPA: PilZ domain-containing protein [Geobacteraceae bacterium]